VSVNTMVIRKDCNKSLVSITDFEKAVNVLDGFGILSAVI
jgi:hypothetical protein